MTGPLPPDITANRILHEDRVTKQDLKVLAADYKKLLEQEEKLTGALGTAISIAEGLWDQQASEDNWFVKDLEKVKKIYKKAGKS